jgi:hypothetical protein
MRPPFVSVAVLVAALAVPAAAQDGGGAPPAPPAGPAAAKKAPKDPGRAVATRIEESLRNLFAGGDASRESVRRALDTAVAEWSVDAKEDPLRSVKWWRTALAAALPSNTKKSGIFEEKVPHLEGREARLWVSLPKSYGPKATSPLVLCVLDPGDDPKRVLPAVYGDLLKEWIVIAVIADAKASGLDIAKEPWLTALGLRWAVENLRVDRDRVVLDAAPGQANLALNLGAEWAVHFAGVVLRGPSVTTNLAPNLALCGTAVVSAENGTDAQKKAADAIKAAAPSAASVPAGKEAQAAIQKWISELPPRRISTGDAPAPWRARPQGGETWGYWLWVFRPAEAKKDRLVSVEMKRDAATGVVDLVADNLAEGCLLLNDDLLDLDREITVRVNGTQVWKGKPERSLKTAIYWIEQTGERTLFAPAEVRFTVPADARAPKKAAGGPPPAAPAAGGAESPPAAPPAPPPEAPKGGDAPPKPPEAPKEGG